MLNQYFGVWESGWDEWEQDFPFAGQVKVGVPPSWERRENE